jgi:hypothetical protein
LLHLAADCSVPLALFGRRRPYDALEFLLSHRIILSQSMPLDMLDIAAWFSVLDDALPHGLFSRVRLHYGKLLR